MAAISAPQFASALRSASGTHDDGGTWEYSVPAGKEQANLFYDPNQSISSERSNLHLEYPQRQTLTPHQTNGNSILSQNSRRQTSQRRANPSDSSYNLRAYNTAESSLQPSIQINSSTPRSNSHKGGRSEADRAFDVYGNPSSRGSGNASMEQEEQDNLTRSPQTVQDGLESSRWIHRDKLAQIESQEMQQAGFHIRRKSESRSRSSRRDRSQDEYATGAGEGERSETHNLVQSEKRQRVASPVPSGLQDRNESGPMEYDLRPPEERASEQQNDKDQYTQLRQPRRKASISRLPLPKSSSIPIPVDYIERNTPTPINGVDKERISYNRPQSRSHSVGSQMLLDDGGEPKVTAQSLSNQNSPQGSPIRARTPGKTVPASNRKVSTTRAVSGQQKPRTSSGTYRNSPGQRPRTTSSEMRPATSINRPEGDPPWLATMYKPDPMLPPDQQLLPTHAKRLQQEQWEKEGKGGSVYDRHGNPLNVYENPNPQLKVQSLEIPAVKEEDGTWPLRSPRSPSSEHGGYKTMPTVQKSSPAPAPSSKPIRPIRVQDPPEAKEKKGGCTCCIIM
ncbi:MAG: hypothetical protein M1827_004856 [Pycnora praestabilis]|nr:MAG: hypothetical protein M1827_004856 [Pycnora praestabilis]